MSAHDHTRFADDVGAYLLGALDADERQAFEGHADACAECRRELDRLAVAVDSLPRAVEDVEPPPELKASLMAIVASEPRSGRSRRGRRPWRR